MSGRWLTGLFVLAAGCAGPRVPLLTAPEPPIVWPKAPDVPRVRYLGALKGSADMHPRKTAGQVWDELIHGPVPPSAMVKPHAVAVHRDGKRVAVADTDAACVHLFDLEKEEYARKDVAGGALKRFECVVAVAWAREALWVADSRMHAIAVFEPGGRSRWVGAEDLKRPAGLAYSPGNDLVYVSDAGAHAVVVFDREGRQAFRFGTPGEGPGQFNCPTHIAVGPDGVLAVVDSLNSRVQRFGPDGALLKVFGRKGDAAGDLALPKGVAAGEDGNLWVVDAQFENVQAFTPEGQLLMAFGKEGSGPGQFWLPAGVCIDVRRRMWVADSYNRRVQVFELLR